MSGEFAKENVLTENDLQASRVTLPMQRLRLLIVEDDEDVRTQMKWALAAECDIAVAADRASALAELREHKPPVMVLDLGLPPHPASPPTKRPLAKPSWVTELVLDLLPN